MSRFHTDFSGEVKKIFKNPIFVAKCHTLNGIPTCISVIDK